MEITAEHIQGFTVGIVPSIITIGLFIYLHFFIDRGSLGIQVEQYRVYMLQRGSGGDRLITPLAEEEYNNVSYGMDLKILLCNKGKRKLSVHTIKLSNPNFKQTVIISNRIVELLDGDSKKEIFNLEISLSESKTVLKNKNTKLVFFDNRGKKKTIKLGKASI
ncbi:hypothetical protein [Halalkalibacter sp. APA_J-10(15)]|uniref:hypothetical protein n=1 Tax=Halalkalibacter sp. APA_J-10(15) TaxID=2933805 RepID=UPI001FF3D15F|nr:hypothetical protein [Halalkalibacter sp. APA_J-10(15)]MCK0470881.1 hypothetical protein [Halalkalibacter sp. APA_J-10(15)]